MKGLPRGEKYKSLKWGKHRSYMTYTRKVADAIATKL